MAQADGVDMRNLPLEELDRYWDKAKAEGLKG